MQVRQQLLLQHAAALDKDTPVDRFVDQSFNPAKPNCAVQQSADSARLAARMRTPPRVNRSRRATNVRTTTSRRAGEEWRRAQLLSDLDEGPHVNNVGTRAAF